MWVDELLPVMNCMRCGDCCGLIGCSQDEFAKVAAFIKRNKIQPRRQGMTCPFFKTDRCIIYEVRPLICRIYGHIDDPLMTCPHGCNVNISPEVKKRIDDKYFGEYNHRGQGLRMLHEFAYQFKEIKTIMVDAMINADFK